MAQIRKKSGRPLQIVAVGRRDIREAVALLAAQMREHRVRISKARIENAVRNLVERPERGFVLLAFADGEAIGVAYVTFMYPLEFGGLSSWLEELYVVPARRQHGIGNKLLLAARKRARDHGCAAMDLEIEAEHARAAHLYDRDGFRKLSRERWVRRL